MNGVIGLTGLLLRGELQTTQRRYAESVRSASTSLLSTINDILDLSKTTERPSRLVPGAAAAGVARRRDDDACTG
jgi:signal transduction histidine kinase